MENNNTKRNIADTMEINSILEEARRNRENRNSDNASDKTIVMPKRQPSKQRTVDDDFVIYDDDKNKGKGEKRSPKNKKKSKKGMIITVVAVIAVLALTFCGYVLYKQFGEFKFADNIVINGISIGGMSESDALDALEAEELRLADSIKIEVKADNKTSVLTKADFSYTFNTEDVIKEAKKYTEDTLVPTGEQTYSIAIKLSNESCAQAASKVSKELDRPAKDATVTKFDSSKKGNDRFVFEDSETGLAIKQTELVTQLHEFVSTGEVSGVIDAQLETTEPKYTKDYLLANITKLSSFTTRSTNDANGNSNMKLSLSVCNNSIINPGATWSFNKCTGDSNQTSRGYKPAGVLVNGRSTTGIGGGICQSSTTIFNAGLLCGMEIVERECHYYPSTYVEVGRDATVDYGNIDLKLKNPFDYQLFMECYMDGVVLHCNIYGIPSKDFDKVDIDSSITSRASGRYTATTTRTFFLDGKKVKTDKPFYSTYYTSGGGGGSSSGNSETPTQRPTEKPQNPTSAPPSSEEGGGTQPPSSESGGGEGGEVNPPSEGGGSEGGSEGGGEVVDPGTGTDPVVAQTPVAETP